MTRIAIAGKPSKRIPMSQNVRAQFFIYAILGLLIVLVSLIGLAFGTYKMTLREAFLAFLNIGENGHTEIVYAYRLPRLAVGLLVGSGLAVSGVIIQSVLRNPLAAPETLGVSAGASLGAVFVTLLLPTSAIGLVPVFGLLGACTVAGLVYAIARRRGAEPARLLLLGIALGAFCNAGVDLIVTRSAADFSTALLWLTGSLWGRDWEQFVLLLPWILLLLPIVWALSRSLDVLQLDKEAATGLGMPIQWTTGGLLACAVGLAASSVAAAGAIGFVGLICPHMARQLVGVNHRKLIPMAALIGALLVISADLIGRLVRPPIEIPAGIVIALIGSPYFVFLLWRQSRIRQTVR